MIKKKDPYLFIPLGLATLFVMVIGCDECEDCGILYKEPVINVRFYNIDSLLKVEGFLNEIEDSLEVVNEEIENGNTALTVIRDALEEDKTGFEKVRKNILDGKIRIEEVRGIDAITSLYFRDSTTHDTLTFFPFPLSMHDDISTFIIEIVDRMDTLQVIYKRREDISNQYILIRAYDLSLGKITYDSAYVSCKKDSCISDETTVSLYF